MAGGDHYCQRLCIVFLGFLFFRSRQDKSQEAPEAETVLNAQLEMSFQILIPAYLPKDFVREKAQVNKEQLGPQGESDGSACLFDPTMETH